jgi:hypothetical protein
LVWLVCRLGGISLGLVEILLGGGYRMVEAGVVAVVAYRCLQRCHVLGKGVRGVVDLLFTLLLCGGVGGCGFG